MPDIIIHGASSFLGKHFVEKLVSKNIPAIVIARESSDNSFCENNELIRIIRYKNNIAEAYSKSIYFKSPVFYEFSWCGVFGTDRNIPEQLSVNIPLIISSIEFAHKVKTKHWIGIGSQAEYGNLDKKISEIDECKPTTLYGKSKLICSKISNELCSVYGIEYSWLRLFSVYGPDDNHEWLIQYIIKEMLKHNEINVTEGIQLWDYIFVDDISEMLLKLNEIKGVGIANLGSGKSVSVKFIIETIKKLTKSNSIINLGAIPYRDDQVMLMEADISKLSNLLNWSPKTSIEEGLKKTIDFINIKENKYIE